MCRPLSSLGINFLLARLGSLVVFRRPMGAIKHTRIFFPVCSWNMMVDYVNSCYIYGLHVKMPSRSWQKLKEDGNEFIAKSRIPLWTWHYQRNSHKLYFHRCDIHIRIKLLKKKHHRFVNRCLKVWIGWINWFIESMLSYLSLFQLRPSVWFFFVSRAYRNGHV